MSYHFLQQLFDCYPVFGQSDRFAGSIGNVGVGIDAFEVVHRGENVFRRYRAVLHEGAFGVGRSDDGSWLNSGTGEHHAVCLRPVASTSASRRAAVFGQAHD